MKRLCKARNALASTFALSLALGLVPSQSAVAAQGAAPQSDLKNAQPERDAQGRILPGRYTVTICKGTFYDMTPKGPNGRDLYQTPHNVRVTSTSGTSASGGEQGENGTIRLKSGAPGIPAGTGDTTITYDIIDKATGAKVQTITVKVKVIDCPPPARAVRSPGGVRAGLPQMFLGPDISWGLEGGLLHTSYNSGVTIGADFVAHWFDDPALGITSNWNYSRSGGDNSYGSYYGSVNFAYFVPTNDDAKVPFVGGGLGIIHGGGETDVRPQILGGVQFKTSGRMTLGAELRYVFTPSSGTTFVLGRVGF